MKMMMLPLFIGATELVLIGGLALLMFGGKKLPEMMRGLGQGVREFKKGVNDGTPLGEEEKMSDEPDENHAGKGENGMKHEERR